MTPPKSGEDTPIPSHEDRPSWVVAACVAGGILGAFYMLGVFGGDPPLGAHRWSAAPRTIALIVFFFVFTTLSSILLGLAKMLCASRGESAVAEGALSPGDAPAEPLSSAALAHDEQRIRARLEEIASQRMRIDSVQEIVGREKPGGALSIVNEKLRYAEDVLNAQESRHRAQLWVIELARWQEQLAHFTARTASGVFGRAGSRLEELAALTGKGAALLTTWEADTRTAATREGARCVAHLKELLGRCEQLREGIVVDEAMLAIRGIEPTENVQRTAALSIEPLESLQTDLNEGGSLAAALSELELEHERLREEDEDARNVERFLGDLESGRA